VSPPACVWLDQPSPRHCPRDRIATPLSSLSAHHESDADGEFTATRTVVLTGDLADVVGFGVGPGWDRVAGVDAGELPWEPATPTPQLWGAGVRLRGVRPGWTPDTPDEGCARH
jgi:hypothetical protein